MTLRTFAASAALLIALAAPAAAAADDPPTLAISGAGVAFVMPDTATLSINARSAARQRTTARSRANKRTQAIIAALTAHGVPRASITTSGISLSRTTRKHKPWYSASNEIDARV